MPPAVTLDDAIALHRSGDLSEAQRAYCALLSRQPTNPDAMGLLGVVESQLGRHDRAAQLLRKASRLSPNNAVILSNLGEALSSGSAYEEAEQALRAALRIDARLVEANTNLGNLLSETGRASEAITAYRTALKGRPDDVQIRYRLGTLLLEAGQDEEARTLLRGAVDADPHHTGALQNLGLLDYRGGDLHGAERAYRAILELDPTHSAALAALGQIRRAQGDAGSAMGFLWEAIRQDPDDDVCWASFAELLGQTELDHSVDTAAVQEILDLCLRHPAVNPQDVAGQVGRLLRRLPGTSDLLTLADADPQQLEAALESPEVWDLLGSSLLQHALVTVVIPDLGLEALLRAMRRVLLGAVLQREGEHPSLARAGLVGALARQCFLNGYLWSFGNDEVQAVESLVESMAGRPLGESSLDVAGILALACYVPLNQWDRVEEVLALAETRQHDELVGVVVQQVVEPWEEADARERIPTLGITDDQVSSAVRAMYEEHPYPRWTRAAVRRARPLHMVLAEVFPGRDFSEYAALDRPCVLVAGCGTGLHLLEVKRRYGGLDLTGLDLSLASLGFAARKLADAGVTDVGLLHGDILSLGESGLTFDVIESVGVLHHMAEPLVGWRTLVDRLRPGGLMRIGLYSEAARHAVVGARAFIAEHGFGDDVDGIRSARQALVAQTGTEFQELQRWRDFFSLQEVRDLLFHVQEHRFTLSQVREALQELNLEFLGFDLRVQGLMAAFRARFPAPAAESDLSCWEQFEAENPTAFAAMYQFWVRKA